MSREWDQVPRDHVQNNENYIVSKNVIFTEYQKQL